MKIKVNDGISLQKFQKKAGQYIDIKTLVKYQKMTKPFVTIAMLSWNRTDELILVLKDLLKHNIPMNLCLTIQECLTIPKDKRQIVQGLVDQFYAADVVWHSENRGTGKPRGETIERALEVFDTPYIFTTDDDMYFPRFNFYTLAALLEHKPEYGVISTWCDPNYTRVIKNPTGKGLAVKQFTQGFHDVECLGSATAMWRREVFDTCRYDQNYYIGWADFDLCIQLSKNNWKKGVLCLNYLKAHNNKKANTKEYTKIRYDINHSKQSEVYFNKKWGFGWR